VCAHHLTHTHKKPDDDEKAPAIRVHDGSISVLPVSKLHTCFMMRRTRQLRDYPQLPWVDPNVCFLARFSPNWSPSGSIEDSPLTGGRMLDVCAPPAKGGVTGLYFVVPHLLQRQGMEW
jgi:hypothetical protein